MAERLMSFWKPPDHEPDVAIVCRFAAEAYASLRSSDLAGTRRYARVIQQV